MADSGRIVNGAWMPALDENGYPIPDAYIRVFTNRTTTLAPIYADEARTVLRSNPVYADSSGQFPPIWQDNTLSFSLEFGSVTKGPIGTVDDLKPSSNIGGLSEKLDRDGGNSTPDFLENVGAQSVDITTYEPTDYKRLLVSKMLDFVNARDAPNFDSSRMTDAKVALESLFAAQGPKGGTIYLPPGDIYVSSLTIPPNIRLIGASGRPGQNDFNRSASRAGTTLWVAPTGTINLLNMSWIEHVQILNPHIKHPQLINNGTATDMTHDQILGTATIPGWPYNSGYGGIQQFAGTAITIGGNDTMVKDCLIIGYNKAIYAGAFFPGDIFGPYPGPSRHNVIGVYMDCRNGIEFTNCWDIPRIRDCNFWVFYCCHLAGPGMQDWDIIARNGTAFNIHDKVDGLMMTNCFASGADFSYRFKDTYASQLVGCTGDGALDQTIAAANGAGLITEGSVLGLHLSSVRCDGNKANFRFHHTQGSIDGKIISGQTSNGIMVEVGSSTLTCQGLTLDLVLAGNCVDAVRIRNGKNIYFTSIDAVFLNPIAGQIIKYDNISDLKRTYIGPVNRDINTNPYGERVLAPLTIGGENPVTAKIEGASSATPFAKVRSINEANTSASLDLEAYGYEPESMVRINRRSYAGDSQTLARFASLAPTPANFLFINDDANNSRITVESIFPDANLRFGAKGLGTVQSLPAFQAGVINTNFTSIEGAASGSNPSVRAAGAGANVGMDVAGKGSGGVFLVDIIASGTRRVLGRFFKGSDTAANFVVNNADSGLVVAGVEGDSANITLAITGKGSGGVRIQLPTYANDAAAAAGGLPVQSLYKTATGEVRVRIA